MGGQLRIATDPLHQALLAGLLSVQAVPPRIRPSQEWAQLLSQALIDGAIVSSWCHPRVLARECLPSWSGLITVPLGTLPLQLVSHPRGQLPVFAVECDPSIKNWTVFHLSKMMRSRGWQVPAYTLPANLQDRAVLRFVIRAGFNHDMADQLLADVQRNLEWLSTAQTQLPSVSEELGFRH